MAIKGLKDEQTITKLFTVLKENTRILLNVIDGRCTMRHLYMVPLPMIDLY